MTLIRSIGALILGTAGAVAAVAVAARFSDGPIGPFAGGPFRSGEFRTGLDIDSEFLAGTPQVELQLVDPPRSRTTHVIVLDGQAYIPSGIVKVGPFVFLGQAFWKRWPYDALEDPRVILRANGKLYQGRAIRVMDPQLHSELRALMAAKYHLDVEDRPNPAKVWFFRLEPAGAPAADR